MPKSTVNDWSTTAANNTDIGGISLAEGWAAANVNNAIRELMKQVADLVAGTVDLTRLDITTANIDTLNLTNALSYTNLTPSGYVTVGSPTGGQQGAGTINATALYDDGVKLHSTFPWAITAGWAQGAVVEDGTLYFTGYAPYAGTISALTYNVGDASGSFSVAVKINGVNVTSLSSVTVNSATTASTSATGANTFVAGDVITAVISSTSGSPANGFLTLRGTRAAA